jgi:hypothetical protein
MRHRSTGLRFLLVFAIGCLSCTAQAAVPSVSNIGFDGGSHSAVGVTFSANQNVTAIRLRYIPVAEGTCKDGTSGLVQSSGGHSFNSTFIRADATGLAPDTEYEFCPEVTSDGVHWSSGAGAKWRTLPLPKVHPALPIPPAIFDSDYPDTTGYATITIPKSCAGLQDALDRAIAMQAVRGTVIEIPAGTVCSDLYHAAPSPDMLAFSGSAVSNNAIHLSAHHLVEGQGIIFGPSGYHGPLPAGITVGYLYFVHRLSPDSFQLYWGAPYAKGGTLVQLRPGAGTQHFVKWPRPLKTIVIRTATPDTQFTPEHVRTSPAWAPKMAIMKLPLSHVGRSVTNILFKPDVDANIATFAANIRFVGIEFTDADNHEPSSDPRSWWAFFGTGPTNSRIILDRCYIHGRGFPNRIGVAFGFDGREMAIKDSYWDNLTYWHGSRSGFDLKQTNPTSFTIAPGIIHYGRTAALNRQISVTFSGKPGIPSPELAVYFDMQGKLTIAVPEGMTAQSDEGTVVSTKQPGNGACNIWDTVFPKDSYGRLAAGPVACVELTPQTRILKLVPGDPYPSVEEAEGCQCFMAGVGPGPFQIENNYIEGSGNIVHFDDTGGTRIRGDYIVERNTFHVPPEQMYGGKLSDGYRYANRQPLEWKGGQRIRINGNIFDSNWSDVTPTGVFYTITARQGGYITDVDVTNNTFRHGPGGVSAITNIDSTAPFMAPPGLRFRLKNNLFWDINGWKYTTGPPSTGALLPSTGGPDEDIIIDHNTFFDNRGRTSQWIHWSGYPVEGVQITNNFLFYSDTGGGGGLRSEGWENSRNCAAMGNEKLMNCGFIAGTRPDYIFAGNVIVPSWRDTSVPSGQVDVSAIRSEFPGLEHLNHIVPGGGGVESSVATIGWLDPAAGDFRLKPDSPYSAGHKYHATDGSDVGVDVDALEAAEGVVKDVHVPSSSITSDSATIQFVAPDTFACSIDYSSSDPKVIDRFVRVIDPEHRPGARSIRISGLQANTLYYYRLNCSVQQPEGQFRTR